MANKLSKAQQEVVDKMREGSVLANVFPMNISRKSYYELDGYRLNELTIDSLIKKNVVEYSHKKHGGITYHYYRLTEKFKNKPE